MAGQKLIIKKSLGTFMTRLKKKPTLKLGFLALPLLAASIKDKKLKDMAV